MQLNLNFLLLFHKKLDEQSFLEDLPFGSKLSIFDDDSFKAGNDKKVDDPQPVERNADHSPYPLGNRKLYTLTLKTMLFLHYLKRNKSFWAEETHHTDNKYQTALWMQLWDC